MIGWQQRWWPTAVNRALGLSPWSQVNPLEIPRILVRALLPQVNRLELTLSIGSFAAALGAVVAGIFGMNLRSTCEESIVGFWGCTGAIIVGCVWVFVAIYKYMRRRRIL